MVKLLPDQGSHSLYLRESKLSLVVVQLSWNLHSGREWALLFLFLLLVILSKSRRWKSAWVSKEKVQTLAFTRRNTRLLFYQFQFNHWKRLVVSLSNQDESKRKSGRKLEKVSLGISSCVGSPFCSFVVGRDRNHKS